MPPPGASPLAVTGRFGPHCAAGIAPASLVPANPCSKLWPQEKGTGFCRGSEQDTAGYSHLPVLAGAGRCANSDFGAARLYRHDRRHDLGPPAIVLARLLTLQEHQTRGPYLAALALGVLAGLISLGVGLTPAALQALVSLISVSLAAWLYERALQGQPPHFDEASYLRFAALIVLPAAIIGAWLALPYPLFWMGPHLKRPLATG